MNTQWSVYLSIVLLSYLSPGPDTIMILRASRFGRGVGLAAAAGALTGLTVYMAISAVGLSAIIAVIPGIIPALSLAGASYLAYLGFRTIAAGRAMGRESDTIMSPSQPTQPRSQTHQSREAFRATLLTNLTNPKVLLFFVAILPQFIDESAPFRPAVQLGILGAVDVLAGLVLLPIVVFFGAYLFGQLSPRGAARFETVVGMVLLTFGAALAAETIIDLP